MPLSPPWPVTKAVSWRFHSRFISTARRMFGRSNPSTNCSTAPPKSFSAMSARVSAATGMPGKSSRSRPSSAYSGRNAGPHCEMQCASSMANSRTGSRPSAVSTRSLISRSGAM